MPTAQPHATTRNTLSRLPAVHSRRDDAPRNSSSNGSAGALAPPAVLLLLAAAEQPAWAAKVCIDVPDWVAELDPAYALLHNPVVAVGAAAAALLLAPKLIKVRVRVHAYHMINRLLHLVPPSALALVLPLLLPPPGRDQVSRAAAAGGADRVAGGVAPAADCCLHLHRAGVCKGAAAYNSVCVLLWHACLDVRMCWCAAVLCVWVLHSQVSLRIGTHLLLLLPCCCSRRSPRGLHPCQEHPAAASIGLLAAAGILVGPDLLAGAAVAGVLVLLAVQAGLLQLPQAPRLPRLLPGQQVVEQQVGRAGKALQQRAVQAAYDADDDGADDRRKSSSSSKSRERQRQQQQQPQQQAAPPVAAAAADMLGGLGRSAGAAAQGLFDRARDALPGAEAVQEGLQSAGKGLGAAAQRLGARALDAVQERQPPQQTQQRARQQVDERSSADVDAIMTNWPGAL